MDSKTTTPQDPVFAPNSAIDADIKRIFPNFSEASQRRMRKAILAARDAALKHDDENTDAAARHIFREFVVASHLNERGFAFEYEMPIEGLKPDWLDVSARLLMESYTFERGGTSTFVDRVVSAVSTKCDRYGHAAQANGLRIVIAVYLDFLTGVTLEECLEEAASFKPVFSAKKSLWAIVFFTDTRVVKGRQEYDYCCLCAADPSDTNPQWPIVTMNVSR